MSWDVWDELAEPVLTRRPDKEQQAAEDSFRKGKWSTTSRQIFDHGMLHSPQSCRNSRSLACNAISLTSHGPHSSIRGKASNHTLKTMQQGATYVACHISKVQVRVGHHRCSSVIEKLTEITPSPAHERTSPHLSDDRERWILSKMTPSTSNLNDEK